LWVAVPERAVIRAGYWSNLLADQKSNQNTVMSGRILITYCKQIVDLNSSLCALFERAKHSRFSLEKTLSVLAGFSSDRRGALPSFLAVDEPV